MISTLTVAGQSVDTVVVPSTPGMRTVELGFGDTVGEAVSPFTKKTQVQEWPGADSWTGTMTLPLLTQPQADQWISFLMQCRGIRNPFLLGDPLKCTPAGNLRGVPLVDNSAAGSNAVGAQSLNVKGFTPGLFRLLLPGDYLQVGWRLHRAMDVVDSDSGGLATIAIWPSLREIPVDSSALIFKNPKGLFRRASNDQVWSATIGRLTSLSFQVKEYR